MSKYEPLGRHLAQAMGVVELSFSDIEALVGFSLPGSARRYPAWWSNSGGTHVQSLAWLSAGYRTEDVSIADERVRFTPESRRGLDEMPQPKYQTETPKYGSGTKDETAAPSDAAKALKHPAFGVWKGLVTLDPNYDYSQPADPDWGKVYED